MGANNYPKNRWGMPEKQQAAFAKLICNNQKTQCPVLLKTECFLSFEQRPVLCTNAYPCFNDRSYWIEKEKKNIQFKKAIDALDVTVQFKKVFEFTKYPNHKTGLENRQLNPYINCH